LPPPRVIDAVALKERGSPFLVIVKLALEVMFVPTADIGPALETAALNIMSPPVVVRFSVAPEAVLDTRLLTVMAPVL
jgi:hypothetical protein